MKTGNGPGEGASTAAAMNSDSGRDAPQGERRNIGLRVLQQRFGPRYGAGRAIREQHGHTLTWLKNEPPDAVIWPQTTSEVADIAAVATQYGLPLIPFGAGTSLEGHVNAPMGGVSLDFSQMDKIISVNDRDLDCVVEAGVSRKLLNEYLRDRGLFFPVDPGAEEATIGGMASTRASGTTAVRYGTMRENVLAMKVVMADGSIVQTARRARKSSAGYDLTRLIVGAEGTLGIITEVTVRVFGIPEVILAASCPFTSMEGACNATILAIQLGLGIARIELLDEMQIRAVNNYAKTSFDEVPTLFLEFHGSKAGARDQVEQFKRIAEEEGALGFNWAAREEDRRALWKARHEAYWAVKTTSPGKGVFSTDVCVPISKLADCIVATQKDLAEHGLIAPIVGHVGDGNFHCLVVVDMEDEGAVRAASAFSDRLIERALAMDGTSTGEHGIGQGKAKYLELEHGAGVAVMRQIKQALDPNGIMNPGKLWPGERQ